MILIIDYKIYEQWLILMIINNYFNCNYFINTYLSINKE